jgi:hypothetical protein
LQDLILLWAEQNERDHRLNCPQVLAKDGWVINNSNDLYLQSALYLKLYFALEQCQKK